MIVLSGIVLIPNVFAENVPDWVKNTAGWWAEDLISETEFVNAIAYLIKVGIINISKECEFFGEEYKHIGEPEQNVLCKFSNFDFVESWYDPYEPKDHEINSFGFRGAEFSKEKPFGTYRIFIVGGSTVFGDGVESNNTIPSLLQNFYSNDKFDNIKQIEVINAGINGGISKHEVDLIKNKLSKMSPDLIIAYDGWNDSKIGNYGHVNWDVEINDESWKNRWADICKSYNNEFDVVIFLQPILGYEKLILTDQEFTNYYTRATITKEIGNLDKLAAHINELNSICSSAHDLRFIMEDVTTGIYYDQGHMTPTGNKIIAKKMHEITLPIIEENSTLITSMNDEKVEGEPKNHQTELNSNLDYTGKIIIGTDFSEKNMPNIVAYFSTFKETDFSSSNLRNMDVKFSNFINVDFSDAQLQDSRISRTGFTNSNFDNADLSQSYLSSSVFIDSDLTNSVFKNSDLRGVFMLKPILEGTNFTNVDFSNSYLENLDFTKSTLQNSKFNGAYIKTSMFDGTDFSTEEIHGDSLTGSPTEFVYCSMKHSNFSKINMFNIDFTSKDIIVDGEYLVYPGSDLSYSTFTDLDLRTTLFSMWSSVEATICPSSDENTCKDVDDRTFFYHKFEIPIDMDPLEEVRKSVSPKLKYATFDSVNLSGSDLSILNLSHSQIMDSDLTNVSLKHSDLSFSSITNSDLSGANLEGANLEGVILDNVIFAGANLKCINHQICVND